MKGKKVSTISVASVISDNDDLLLEILILLPAKSLIRFKSVSKHWHFLVSDASFRQLHSRRHHRGSQTSFLLCSSPSSSQFYHFDPKSKNLVPFHLNLDEVKILQSCNGLMLVQSRSPKNDYFVYNPTTGESRSIFRTDLDRLEMFLHYDPSESPHYFVFCLPSLFYDSETHQWYTNGRDDRTRPLREDIFGSTMGVESNDFIYAVAHGQGLGGSIFCFDTYKFMRGLPFFEYYELEFPYVQSVICVMESFGHVHRFSRNLLTNCLEVDEILWTGKNGEQSFKRLIEFDVTPWCPDKTSWNITFLGIMRGGEESLVFHIPGKIMAYRFFEGRFEELLDCSGQGFYNDRLSFSYGNSCQFVESLAPV